MEYIVEILRLNNEGKGIGKIADKIVFVSNALPNEIVKIKIIKENKNYLEGKLLEIIEKSSDRIDSICPYYKECGGCDLMHLKYEKELVFKKETIKNIFKKISNIDIDIKDITISNLNYRNKVVLRVKNDKLGFYKNKTNDIIDIEKCFISNDKINEIIKRLKEFINNYKDNNINEIMIRTFSETMICLDNINNSIKNNFIEDFNDIDSIYINNENVYGKNQIIQKQNNLIFNVSKDSFFQVNKEVSEKLYNEVLNNINENETVLDLYSGTGTISSIVSKKAKKVIGIERVKDAVKNAKTNIKNNNITNVSFICSKVENSINSIKEKIDVIVLDPPRSGSDKKTLNTILKIKPNKIIYISCNPVTLARDYNTLKEIYEIKSIKAFDMFRETHHVETVCILKMREDV